MIQFQAPTISNEEIKAVRRVMETAWVGPGPESDAFIADFANYAGIPADHFTGVSSCTDALFFALQVVASKKKGEIVIPSICYSGVAHAAVTAGLTTRFCDVDCVTLCARPEDIASRISSETVAIVVLHYGGLACEIESIASLAADRGLILIEDAACAPATFVGGRLCGTIADFGVWSFDAAKLVTSLEGGIAYARDLDDVRALRRLSNLGMERRSGFAGAAVRQSKWWEDSAIVVGRRSVLPDVNAAVGRVQLARVDELNTLRKRLWERYQANLIGTPRMTLPPARANDDRSSFYYFWLFLPENLRDGAAAFLLEKGIYTTVKYPPLHRNSLFGGNSPHLPHAEAIGRSALLLPLHANLTVHDVDFVCASLQTFLTNDG